MDYTENIHAERLLKMLNKEDPCYHCPAAKYFNPDNPADELWDEKASSCCNICLAFVGLPAIPNHKVLGELCPCRVLGNKEALKRTYTALEEKGYLEKGIL